MIPGQLSKVAWTTHAVEDLPGEHKTSIRSKSWTEYIYVWFSRFLQRPTGRVGLFVETVASQFVSGGTKSS